MALEDSGGAALGAATSVGSAAAQGGMNPIADITAAIGLVGLGTSLFGSNAASAAAQRTAAISKEVSGLEMKVNDQRQLQMNLQGQRQQLQTIRNSQLARSLALTSATSQGAQMGTGLQGGFGQISGDTNTQNRNVGQNLQIGNNIFSLDNQISQRKMMLADASSSLANAQGTMAIGGAITKSAGPIGQLSGQFFAQPKSGASSTS